MSTAPLQRGVLRADVLQGRLPPEPSPQLPSAQIPRRKSGQAIIESFGVIMLLCLILFGVVQLVLMYTAREINQYAADASVRARAVGFNRFMVFKVNRVASIANAGPMTTPGRITSGDATAWHTMNAGQSFFASIRAAPRSRQFAEIEQWTIPLFLGAENHAQLPGILDYRDWSRISSPIYTGMPGFTVGVQVHHDFPLRMPFWRAFSRRDHIRLRAEARLADHADLYLDR